MPQLGAGNTEFLRYQEFRSKIMTLKIKGFFAAQIRCIMPLGIAPPKPDMIDPEDLPPANALISTLHSQGGSPDHA
jgi:hypothetical protein